MEKPGLPKNEEERVKAVRKLELLDTPIEERFEKIVRLACSTMQVPIASFVLIDSDRQWIKATQGLKAYETSRDIAFCAHTILEEDVMVVPDARKDKRFSANPFVIEDPNITFYAGCPVHDPSGHKIGTLCVVDNKARDMDDDDKQNLRDLAGLIERELKVRQLEETQTKLVHELDGAKRRALTDPLTRLWNRAGMSELMKRAWAQAVRQQTEIVVVMADIDHFKQINDEHGHHGGDAALREVSRAMLSAVRSEDVVGRVGGEEFLIILTDCAKGAALDTADRIRQAVEKTAVYVDKGPLKVTISMGVAALVPDKDDVPGALVKMADLALYTAKARGRNRVEPADPSLGNTKVHGADPFTYDIPLDL